MDNMVRQHIHAQQKIYTPHPTEDVNLLLDDMSSSELVVLLKDIVPASIVGLEPAFVDLYAEYLQIADSEKRHFCFSIIPALQAQSISRSASIRRATKGSRSMQASRWIAAVILASSSACSSMKLPISAEREPDFGRTGRKAWQAVARICCASCWKLSTIKKLAPASWP